MNLIYQIKNDLAKHVNFGSMIFYSDFQRFYLSYKDLLPEIVFAVEVMNIRESNFRKLKYENKPITLSPFLLFNEEIVEKIKEKMKKRFLNSKIDYKTFKVVYQEYSCMVKEADFAKEIFNINNSFFHSFKNEKYSARVFTAEERFFVDNYMRLYDYFYPLYYDKSIDYVAFKSLHDMHASYLTEVDFAICLGLSYEGYRAMKRKKRKDGQGIKTKLFKMPKANYSLISLETLETIYRNKKINYFQFEEIFKQYGNGLSEEYFARALGIHFGTFNNFKRKRILYLLIFKRELNLEEKNQILLSCRNKGLTRRMISYDEFSSFYAPYKDIIAPTDFAYIIGIKQNSMHNLKRVKALALSFDFNIHVKKMIRYELKDYHYQYISYQKFLELYEPYASYLTKTEFYPLLGISYFKYYSIKNNEKDTALIDFFKTERQIIKHQLSMSRVCTYSDFEKMGEMLEINVEKILLLYFGEEKADIALKYLNVLNDKKQLFIGSTPLKDFSIMDDVLSFCQNYSKAVCLNLQCIEIMEEISHNAILYIIENCGSYEINFGQEWFSFCKPYIVGVMKRWCIQYKYKKCFSLDKTGKESGKNAYDFLSIDQTKLFNDLQAWEGNDLYEETVKAIQDGADIDTILQILANQNHVTVKDIMEILKKQMEEKDLIKMDSRGRFLLK